MNFLSLKTRIQSIIGRAPNALCYELVTADINQELRIKEMEATTTLTEAASVTLPADFLEVIDVYRDVDPRQALRPITTNILNRAHETSGVPAYYSIVDGAMLLTPAPNGSEDLVLRYYAKLDDLALDGDTNDVLTSFPSVYVYGVLSHHAALIRDNEALASWFAAYEKAKKQAMAATNKSRYGGGVLIPRPGAVA